MRSFQYSSSQAHRSQSTELAGCLGGRASDWSIGELRLSFLSLGNLLWVMFADKSARSSLASDAEDNLAAPGRLS